MDKGNSLDRLRAWAKLSTMRDQDIVLSRDNGASWATISEATGLSRQALHTIYQRAKD